MCFPYLLIWIRIFKLVNVKYFDTVRISYAQFIFPLVASTTMEDLLDGIVYIQIQFGS